jgi:flavin reductase (DIM6/NTAB) family NADH-FMN oxidoreductase RutF
MKHLLTGLTVKKQYVCVPLEQFSEPLSVFMTIDRNYKPIDVTHSHVFLGYKPLIILLPLDENVIRAPETLCLNFVGVEFHANMEWHGFPSDQRCLARLILKKIQSKPLIQNFYLYEGVHGEHRFLNLFYQFINRKRASFRKENPNNVSLPGNLYDQVRIAYSTPRTIPLITVHDANRMNMFPTDLHGSVGDKYYASSLRIGGKANEQVEASGKIALSFMPVEEFQYVYSLGKNHMKEMTDIKTFSLHFKRSAIFNIPIPARALSYFELKRIASVNLGIHCVHIYEKVYSENISVGYTLSHIHQFYAQWRINHGFVTSMFSL